MDRPTHLKESQLERALRRAWKFNAADLAANQNGHLGLNQRLRLLVRGLVLLLFPPILVTLTALAYMALQSVGAYPVKFLFFVALADVALVLVVGRRSIKMLMDVCSSQTIKQTGRLRVFRKGQRASVAIPGDTEKFANLSVVRLLIEGLDSYLIKWTREPDDVSIPLPLEVLRSARNDRQCVVYYSRWSHRPLAIELEPDLP